jgi:hypothetical protein
MHNPFSLAELSQNGTSKPFMLLDQRQTCQKTRVPLETIPLINMVDLYTFKNKWSCSDFDWLIGLKYQDFFFIWSDKFKSVRIEYQFASFIWLLLLCFIYIFLKKKKESL